MHVGVEVLRSLGYEVDAEGEPLVSGDQILELKPQDIVIPENIAADLVRIGQLRR